MASEALDLAAALGGATLMSKIKRPFVLSNIAITVFGTLLFLFACAILFFSDSIQDFISKTTSDLMGVENRRTFKIDIYLQNVAHALAEVGTYLIVLGLLGLCGFLKRNIPCLICFIVMIVVMMVIQFGLGIILLLYHEKVTEYFKPPMYDLLRKEYRGYNGTDTVSFLGNYMMLTYQCCGIVGYKDFERAKLWSRKAILIESKDISKTQSKETKPLKERLTTPIMCCKSRGAAFDEMLEELSKNVSCAITPTKSNSNKDKGCHDILTENLQEYFIYMGMAMAFAISFEFSVMCAAYKLIKSIQSKRGKLKNIPQTPPNSVISNPHR